MVAIMNTYSPFRIHFVWTGIELLYLLHIFWYCWYALRKLQYNLCWFYEKTIVLKVNYRYNHHDFSKLQPCLYWWCNINSTTLIVRFTREEKTDVTRVTPLPPMFKNIIIVNVKDHTNSTSRYNSKRYLSEMMVNLRKGESPYAISM